MKRGQAALFAVVLVVLLVGVGVGTFLLVRPNGPRLPEISAYSHGHLTRVGPYFYCNLNLKNCQTPETLGDLPASERYPVQLSVPERISRAPWRLLLTYEDVDNAADTLFRPNSRMAVTIPTVDPHRGRLTGIVVQLLTLLPTPSGEQGVYRHAEWSVRLSY